MIYELITKAINKRKQKWFGDKADLINDEIVGEWRFYFGDKRCLIGRRSGNFYYGYIMKNGEIVMYMSRYLSWGKDGFKKEPIEIPKILWLLLFVLGK